MARRHSGGDGLSSGVVIWIGGVKCDERKREKGCTTQWRNEGGDGESDLKKRVTCRFKTHAIDRT